ncbi:MAG: IclR family transcriptional regulator [Chloroflexi bacterium]|nr:IclR family transcriptional regulator [Chloroflexota bacterium]
MSREENKSFVPTIERTFRILEALAANVNGCGISELSNELGIAKSTTFNILATLTELGYIYRSDGDNKFHLSLKLFSLGSTVVERLDLRRISASILQELVDATGETANLGTIQGDEAVYIECLSGPHPVTVNTWPGKRLPLHSTALGKALLAWLPQDQARAILLTSDRQDPSIGISARLDRFLSELVLVRVQRYAVDNEEDAIGLRCVGAPIFDYTGQVVAAISLTAPTQRMPLEQIPETAVLVVASAQRISRRLGFAPELHGQASST